MTGTLTKQQVPTSSRNLLRGIWSYLSRRRRIQFGLLFLVMLASGGAELMALGAVLPFLAVLSDPELFWQQQLTRDLAVQLGFDESTQLVLPATLLFATAAVLAALIRLSNLWFNNRLSAAVGSDLSCEVYARTLYQPYEVHVQRNSASMINTITAQIASTVESINAMLQLLTAGVVALGLFFGLLWIDAPVALGSSALFGCAYVTLGFTSRRELRTNGEKITEGITLQLKSLHEGLGAIRDVLLDGTQTLYLQTYRQADRPIRQLLAKNSFLTAFPRFLLEGLGMVAIALLGGILVLQRGSGTAVVPLLGALALGAQRLLPALQQIYSSWATLKGTSASVDAVLRMLKQALPPSVGVVDPLPLSDGIRLKDVHFSYGPDQPEVLQALDLEIRRGERIGLIGSTGSGKSTMVDLIMALLKPSNGSLLVDGLNIHDPLYPERVNAWRATISHVPQNIYLTDGSIAENIAFGVPNDLIDLARVKIAAEQAQIASFIETTTDSYASCVGERGVRLSGGQRQRIGIARALYKESSLIIFDEATSALDSTTEKNVMESVESLSQDLTIVMIAHRLSTIQRCDRVIQLEHGHIVSIGSPSQYLTDNN